MPGWKSVKKRRDSDGNLVNVGNFDAKGVNVNRNRPDNSNPNLGVSLSRSLRTEDCPMIATILFVLYSAFRGLNPATQHLTDLNELLGEL